MVTISTFSNGWYRGPNKASKASQNTTTTINKENPLIFTSGALILLKN
jgi:hypothetical protein